MGLSGIYGAQWDLWGTVGSMGRNVGSMGHSGAPSVSHSGHRAAPLSLGTTDVTGAAAHDWLKPHSPAGGGRCPHPTPHLTPPHPPPLRPTLVGIAAQEMAVLSGAAVPLLLLGVLGGVGAVLSAWGGVWGGAQHLWGGGGGVGGGLEGVP